jgi:hypothetical protein
MLVASLCLVLAAAPATPRLSTLPIPGTPAFAKTARSVVESVFTVDPSVAANAGLFADSIRVPSFTAASVKKQVARLDRDLAALRAMPWRKWSVDRQIDFRWVYANAELARRVLADERMYLRRPSMWLESFANTLIAFGSYAPKDTASVRRLWKLVPGMIQEAREVCTEPTVRDVTTARELLSALIAMAEGAGIEEARAAVPSMRAYQAELARLKPARDFAVIGAESYAWRLQRVLLLPLSPEQLLARAKHELARVEAELAALEPKVEPEVAPTAEQHGRAKALTRESLLRLYDSVEQRLREATLASNFVTIPAGVGPIVSRETPEAMVPLTGDGGSMNPPPPYVTFNTGYWNVEHFKPEWTQEERLKKVVAADDYQRSALGPYAAHEGFPGHHLQLAIARLHKNPLRSVLMDSLLIEGWALYAEEALWRHGGFGASVRAHRGVLRSYLARIGRVVYDVNIETGVWTLEEGAKFRYRAKPEKTTVDEDVLRAIQWPTQLICYFTGKMQIIDLREELRKNRRAKFSERDFHDALLAEGSIPVALIRAKLVGTPVPDI